MVLAFCIMMKTTLFLITLLTIISQTGCVNKHGISAKYYSDCDEYYDFQGFYHKECGKDDVVTYKKLHNLIKKKPKQPEGNVW